MPRSAAGFSSRSIAPVIDPEPETIDGDRQIQRLRLYFRDFTGTTQEMVLKLRVDITEFDRLVLPVQRRRLIHPYSDAAECNDSFPCMKLEEALADKLRALMQRQYSHDLFDLVYGVFINRELEVTDRDRSYLPAEVPVRPRCTDAERPPPGLAVRPDAGLLGTLVLPAISRFSFEDAVARFRDGLVDLFAPFAVPERRATGFFPAEYRAAILRGGSDRSLLRMTYDGVSGWSNRMRWCSSARRVAAPASTSTASIQRGVARAAPASSRSSRRKSGRSRTPTLSSSRGYRSTE